jgi:nucleoside 2-deoxyribosyltransferase
MFRLLASPLVLPAEQNGYRDRTTQLLDQSGSTVLDPWDQTFHSAIEETGAIQLWSARVQVLKEIATKIGKANKKHIRSCDAGLGLLGGGESVACINPEGNDQWRP